MLRSLILTVSAAFILGFSVPALAEGMTNEAYTAVLLDLNRVKPTQNPSFTLGKDKLNARLVDKNQRTIGKVEDIVLTPEGKFQTIMAEIDTSGFRESAAFDVASYVIDPSPDSFTINMDKTQIKQNQAALMNGIASASGADGPYTLTQIKNSDIFRADGTSVAKTQDVLVDDRARQVIALIVTILNGSNRGATIAIPYEAAQAKHVGNKTALTVTDDQARIMTSMATRR